MLDKWRLAFCRLARHDVGLWRIFRLIERRRVATTDMRMRFGDFSRGRFHVGNGDFGSKFNMSFNINISTLYLNI